MFFGFVLFFLITWHIYPLRYLYLWAWERCLDLKSSSPPQKMPVENIESAEQLETYVRDNEVVVVDFWATWCGPCKKFKPTYEKISKEKKYEDVLFLAVNCDELEEIASQERITSFPTFKVFLRGEEAAKFSGASAEKLKSALEKVLSKI